MDVDNLDEGLWNKWIWMLETPAPPDRDLKIADKRVKKGNRVVQEKGTKVASFSSPVARYLPIYFKELHDIDRTRDLNGGRK